MSLEHSPIRDANGKGATDLNGRVVVDPRDFNLWAPLYSVKQTLSALNISRATLYDNLIAKDRLHPVKQGRRTFFLAADLARYLAELQAEPGVLLPSPRWSNKPSTSAEAQPAAPLSRPPGRRRKPAKAQPPAAPTAP